MTAGSVEVANSLRYLRNSVDVPAGIEAALERRFTDAGVPAVGLWAQVPHYVSNVPYPAASVALLDGLKDVAGSSPRPRPCATTPWPTRPPRRARGGVRPP